MFLAAMLGPVAGYAQQPGCDLRDADVAAAMHGPPATLWGPPLRSDGTARGDTAARFGALVLADLEGGDAARGLRLLCRARQLGVADSSFYLPASVMLLAYHLPDLALAVADKGLARWPRLASLWRAKASALKDLRRPDEARAARSRAEALATDPSTAP